MTGFFSVGARGILGLLPRRVFRDNQLRHNQLFDEMLARVDGTGERFDVTRPLPSSAENLTGFQEYYYFLFRIASPVYSGFEQRYLDVETQLDQTRVACALERFHLSRGMYPEVLAELVPAFLEAIPEDPFARAPLKYQRTEHGTYRFYSIGKNRIDDEGVINPKKSARQQLDDIWPYAPKTAPSPAVDAVKQ